jgi:hypothetical protein
MQNKVNTYTFVSPSIGAILITLFLQTRTPGKTSLVRKLMCATFLIFTWMILNTHWQAQLLRKLEVMPKSKTDTQSQTDNDEFADQFMKQLDLKAEKQRLQTAAAVQEIVDDSRISRLGKKP